MCACCKRDDRHKGSLPCRGKRACGEGPGETGGDEVRDIRPCMCLRVRRREPDVRCLDGFRG